jgi:hypothetical protein
MSTGENKLIVRRCLEEVVSTGDVGGLAKFIAPDSMEVNLDKVVDGRIVEHGGAANLREPFLEAGAIRVVD